MNCLLCGEANCFEIEIPECLLEKSDAKIARLEALIRRARGILTLPDWNYTRETQWLDDTKEWE